MSTPPVPISASVPSAQSFSSRVIAGDEKAVWVPALCAIYAERSGFGLADRDEAQWQEALNRGRVVLIEREDVSIGAVFFTEVVPGDGAVVHVIRWEEPSSRWEWLEVLTKVVQETLRDLALMRIEAYIPEGSQGALDLAEEIGMERVGHIPDGVRLADGDFRDLDIYLIHRERWDGRQ